MESIRLIIQITNCPENSTNSECLTNIPQVAADNSTLTTGLGIVFAIIGVVSVIIIIVQGINFVLSKGEPDKAASARKGVIYAVIGLGISVSANIIVLILLNDIL